MDYFIIIIFWNSMMKWSLNSQVASKFIILLSFLLNQYMEFSTSKLDHKKIIINFVVWNIRPLQNINFKTYAYDKMSAIKDF